jgi:hypothetical protein
MPERFTNSSRHESTRSKALLGHYFSTLKQNFNRCLAPGFNCKEPAIRSHSIQNSRVLDLLVKNGHLKMLAQTATKEHLTTDFKDVGRNEASTFSGFCAGHDSSLFAPIDNRLFDAKDQEFLFLMAYRSIARELHTCMNWAIKLQNSYRKRVELGIDSGDEPGEAGMMAVERMLVAYETHLYKEPLDEAINNRQYSALRHTTFVVEHDFPHIAASSFFDLLTSNERGERPRITLNVFPTSVSETVALFSYTSEDETQATEHLRGLTEAKGEYQKYLLSRLILSNCENFVIAPEAFDMWSEERKNAICKFYIETVRFDSDRDNKNLYLF